MGKSTVLNFLIGDESMKTFEAARSVRGVTRGIKIVSNCKFLGDDQSKLISVVDVPGIGDPTLKVEDILSAVETDLKTSKIDMVLLVLKATDDRVTLAEVMVMNMFKLLKEISPRNIVVVFTRCDQEDNVPGDFIQQRLAMLSTYARSTGLTLDPNNVVKFNKTKESLRSLSQLLRAGNIGFKDNLVKQAHELTEGLPDLIRGGDPEQIAELTQQLAELMQTLAQKEEQDRRERKELERKHEVQMAELSRERKEAELRHREQLSMMQKSMEELNIAAAESAARDREASQAYYQELQAQNDARMAKLQENHHRALQELNSRPPVVIER
jgi:hypothetical protein